MRTPFFIILLLVLVPSISHAQDSIEVQRGKLYGIPVPVLASNPAFGLLFGAAGSFSIFLGEPTDTRLSTSSVAATYSSKDQLMFSIKSTAYTARDEWILQGDIRAFFSSQPTYGLGTGPQSAKLAGEGIEYEDGHFSKPIVDGQLMEFNLIRFHQTAMKRFAPHFYAGIGYHLDLYFGIKDQLLDTVNIPPVLTSHFLYSIVNGFDPERYSASGISFNTSYDSRDNVNNPYEGFMAFLSLQVRPTWMGSTRSYTNLWVEYRSYFNLRKRNPRNLVALWIYGNFTTSGTPPYMTLPALGWDLLGKSGRAYPQGRFRGEHLIYGEVEWRIPIPIIKRNRSLLGATIFLNGTTASGSVSGIDLFEYINPGMGAGLRVLLNKKTRSNITLDYGFGSYGAGAFYFNLNEYF
ncbi:BamA/TamA family outer membrane protein [Pontibacter sp. G13]|uniref:BamA/TamA family outer membrane protein n=1 Tax=Pontibacter sp. G13 TaxID=3074898 RepID=UPI00288BCA94|nr:BamA/TamA family outer membrane protein [Pontibacter sp. G13]WNJ18719.1 hypothetical protein RJD25_28010 [Pontibacter sp. G13]